MYFCAHIINPTTADQQSHTQAHTTGPPQPLLLPPPNDRPGSIISWMRPSNRAQVVLHSRERRGPQVGGGALPRALSLFLPSPPPPPAAAAASQSLHTPACVPMAIATADVLRGRTLPVSACRLCLCCIIICTAVCNLSWLHCRCLHRQHAVPDRCAVQVCALRA